MNEINNKIDTVDYARRAYSNAIAFFITSTCFLTYWIAFLVMGVKEQPKNYSLYLFFVVLELIFNSLIIILSAFSILKKNQKRYEYFFTWDLILLSIATFPMPFAYLFSAGIGNASIDNEIASMATPTTIFCILALFFAAASLEKYQEQDITAHKAFIRLAVGSLFAAAIYAFACMIYKISVNTNPEGLLTTVYYYTALTFIYLALCVYGIISVAKEMSLPSFDIKRKVPNSNHSMFEIANIVYLAYALINIVLDCYNLASAIKNDNSILSIKFGKVDSYYLLGNEIFLFLIHFFMLVYAFLLLHDRQEKNRKDPLFSLSILSVLFCLSYAVPGTIGGYGIVMTYLSSRINMVPYIIPEFSIITFAFVGLGTSMAGLFFVKKRRIDAAIFIAVASFMMVGVIMALYIGEINLLIQGERTWNQSIPSLIESLPDLSLVFINLLALSKEYPKITNKKIASN